MNKQNNSHVSVLDSLRAFAALSVCLYHFVCTTTGYISTKWILDVFANGKYGVQMFFVISGFVIPWSMSQAGFKFKNFFSFFLKRISRLEPPYLFSLLIAIALLILRSNFYDTTNLDFSLNIKQIALHIGYLIPFFDGYKWLNQVYWTLAVEFQYYLFMALVFIPLINSNFFGRLVFYLIIIGLSFLSDQKFLLYWLPVFAVGILVFFKTSSLINDKEFYIVLLFYFIFSMYKYNLALCFFEFTPVIMILYYKDLKLFLLNRIGEFSYSIYLLHTLIGGTFINVMSHYFYSPFMKLMVIVSGLIITIIAARLMFFFIEKPSKKLSASIRYKN